MWCRLKLDWTCGLSPANSHSRSSVKLQNENSVVIIHHRAENNSDRNKASAAGLCLPRGLWELCLGRGAAVAPCCLWCLLVGDHTGLSVCLRTLSWGKLWLPEASVNSKSCAQKHRRGDCPAKTGRQTQQEWLSAQRPVWFLVLQPEE